MEKVIVIPARLNSTRLPEKPLIEIEGKSIVQRTYEQCLKVFDKSVVYIATDSEKIINHCKKLDMNVVLTSDKCLTGTDRVAEFAKKFEADYYINVQGDEPIINPDDLKKIEKKIDVFYGKIINGYARIKDESEYWSTSIPKVVYRKDGRLLYMSRSPLPGNKTNTLKKAWKQICIYAFPKKSLLDFTKYDRKSRFEEIEDIEILRFLEMGYDVQMVPLTGNSIAVDTPEDLEKVKNIIKKNG